MVTWVPGWQVLGFSECPADSRADGTGARLWQRGPGPLVAAGASLAEGDAGQEVHLQRADGPSSVLAEEAGRAACPDPLPL